MASRTKYTVTYPRDQLARFSDYQDALDFARMWGWSQVSDRTGLIAQFEGGTRNKPGTATPEFAHLDR